MFTRLRLLKRSLLWVWLMPKHRLLSDPYLDLECLVKMKNFPIKANVLQITGFLHLGSGFMGRKWAKKRKSFPPKRSSSDNCPSMIASGLATSLTRLLLPRGIGLNLLTQVSRIFDPAFDASMIQQRQDVSAIM